MKDSTQYQKLLNELNARASAIEALLKAEEFARNAPAREYANRRLYTDIIPYEVVATSQSGKQKTIREMNVRLIQAPSAVAGGFLAHSANSEQEWEITPNETACTHTIRLNRRGQWRSASGDTFSLGSEPIKFYDRNF